MSDSSRRWIFRITAVILGLMPIVVLELILRFADSGHLLQGPAPTVQFTAHRPLFVLDEEKSHYVISPERQPFFRRDQFAAKKDPREFRIFCLGGSTVQGNPYSIETAFTTWLELSLQAADDRRLWQVVNCGGISYASYRLQPILEECLRYQPDLFILYLGDNEFLEDRTYSSTGQYGQLGWLHDLRLFRAASDWYRGRTQSDRQRTSGPIQLAAEVDALLDYQGGLAQYHREDRWREAVINHFRVTLNQMVQDAQSAGVQVLLIDPVSNLKDCPPFKVEIDKSLSQDDQAKMQSLLEQAAQAKSPDLAIGLLRDALSIDGRHAGAWFLLGQAYLEVDQDVEAREAFLRAKDEDVCPLRMIEPMRKIIDESGRRFGVPVVPAKRLFEEKSPHGIPGDELLLDHVHPSITGHQMIADLLLAELKQQGVVKPKENWKQKQQERYREHLATLDTPYYARGQEHLDGLRKWAQGRVKKVRPGTKN